MRISALDGTGEAAVPDEIGNAANTGNHRELLGILGMLEMLGTSEPLGRLGITGDVGNYRER